MNYLKSNITFSLEKRKKEGILIEENLPIRMRVTFLSYRVDFFTGYRVDFLKWDNEKEKVIDGSLNKLNQSALFINEALKKQKNQIVEILNRFDNKKILPTPEMLRNEFKLMNNLNLNYKKTESKISCANRKTLLIIQEAVSLGFEFSDIQEIQDIRFSAKEFLKKEKTRLLK